MASVFDSWILARGKKNAWVNETYVNGYNRNWGSCFCGYNKDLFMQLDMHSLKKKLVAEMKTRLI